MGTRMDGACARSLTAVVRTTHQARKARRYDVSKSVLDKGARKFWCTQFGAEHHEVATGRLIETLLFESKAAASYTDADRTVVYGMLRKVLDGNQDGSVSPGELHNFLAYFGPLPDCVRRTVDSLVEFRSEDSSRTVPWFVFTELDRSTVDIMFPREVRCAIACLRGAALTGLTLCCMQHTACGHVCCACKLHPRPLCHVSCEKTWLSHALHHQERRRGWVPIRGPEAPLP